MIHTLTCWHPRRRAVTDRSAYSESSDRPAAARATVLPCTSVRITRAKCFAASLSDGSGSANIALAMRSVTVRMRSTLTRCSTCRALLTNGSSILTCSGDLRSTMRRRSTPCSSAAASHSTDSEPCSRRALARAAACRSSPVIFGSGRMRNVFDGVDVTTGALRFDTSADESPRTIQDLALTALAALTSFTGAVTVLSSADSVIQEWHSTSSGGTTMLLLAMKPSTARSNSSSMARTADPTLRTPSHNGFMATAPR